MKTHHSLGDGLAISTFLLSLSEYDAKSLPGLKPMGLIKNILINMAMLYRVPLVSWRILISWAYLPFNSIKRGNKLSGIKKVGLA